MRILKVLAFACLLAPVFSVIAAETEVQPPKPGPGQMVEDSTYIIGPGDALEIFVWNNPDLSASVTVRPDGKVSTRLVEDIVAAGQTPSGLASLIKARIEEYIRSPQVYVSVTNAKSEYSKVTVIGSVANPQVVPFQQGMTVLDVVLKVGGLGDFAAGNRAKILRKGPDGKQQEIRVRLADLVKKSRMKENVAVQPGDILSVPESRF